VIDLGEEHDENAFDSMHINSESPAGPYKILIVRIPDIGGFCHFFDDIQSPRASSLNSFGGLPRIPIVSVPGLDL
jgi:hypothetical protein